MKTEDRIKFYNNFIFEDFLEDDYFIYSINNPTEESIRFWELYSATAVNLEHYKRAKEILKSYRNEQDNNPHIDVDNRIDRLWERIETSKTSKASKTRKKLALYILASAAAIALLIIVAFPFSQPHTNDITAFAESSSFVEDNIDNENIRLIVSDDQTIEIADRKEAIISLDNGVIKVDDKDIVDQQTSTFNQLIVPKGKRSQLILADGSRLHINSGSRVIYPVAFSSEKREIYVDGEIWIDVKKDQHVPFVVSTSKVNIEVKGTSFNVQAYKSEACHQIVLQTGSIKVTNTPSQPSFSYLLEPSDLFELENDITKIAKVDVEKYTSWLNGVYYYESEPLKQITAKLSRYFGVEVVCTDRIAPLICSGKIDIDKNIDEVLSNICYVFNLECKKTDDNKYLLY